MRDGEVQQNIDVISSRISARTKDLVEHNDENSVASQTKFDEMMSRLKKTAATHKASIRTQEGSGTSEVEVGSNNKLESEEP